MDLIGRFVIVPMSFAALVTGIIQGLGTEWGLFRYYWVVSKLALTIGSTLLLVVHQFGTVAAAAQRASGLITEAELPAQLIPSGMQLVFDSALAIIVLTVATVLSVYKPWGLTPYGVRQLHRDSDKAVVATASLRFNILLVAAGAILIGIIAAHLAGGAHGHHFH
jgi:hypothetical protein